MVDEVIQTEAQSAGSRDVEGEAVVVQFAAVGVVSDLTVESILQVKQVEMEFVSAIPMIPNPDPKYVEGEVVDVAAAVVAAAAVPGPTLGPIQFDSH